MEKSKMKKIFLGGTGRRGRSVFSDYYASNPITLAADKSAGLVTSADQASTATPTNGIVATFDRTLVANGVEKSSSSFFNHAVNGYDTFNGASADGFHAISDGSGVAGAATSDNISIVSGTKYRVSWGNVLASGAAPRLIVREQVFTGTVYALVADTEAVLFVEFVASGTDTVVAYFDNQAEATEYTISSFTFQEMQPTAILTKRVASAATVLDTNYVDYSAAAGLVTIKDGTAVTLIYNNVVLYRGTVADVSVIYNKLHAKFGDSTAAATIIRFGVGDLVSTGTCTLNTIYKVSVTQTNNYGTGVVAGNIFVSAGTETNDANNKVWAVNTS